MPDATWNMPYGGLLLPVAGPNFRNLVSAGNPDKLLPSKKWFSWTMLLKEPKWAIACINAPMLVYMMLCPYLAPAFPKVNTDRSSGSVKETSQGDSKKAFNCHATDSTMQESFSVFSSDSPVYSTSDNVFSRWVEVEVDVKVEVGVRTPHDCTIPKVSWTRLFREITNLLHKTVFYYTVSIFYLHLKKLSLLLIWPLSQL